ncbi:MAG TPA: MFS transporter [Chitinophagaceae bacterium]|nr:MFS transporter [Chitinophagaceae bacterium]
MNKYNKRSVFIAACMGMLLFGICFITLGSVAAPLKEKFALDGVAAGTLFSILPLGILTGSFLFGPVCDRYGYQLLLALACIGLFAGFEGIALSPSLFLLKICVYVVGVCGGIINGATNALVADISTTNKSANLSILGVFFGLGALGMPLLLGLLTHYMAPLHILALVGGFTLIVAITFYFIRFPAPKQPEAGLLANWSSLLNNVLFIAAFFLFFQSSLEAIINNWTTTYLTEQSGVPEKEALFALSVHIAGMVLMRMLSGSVLRNVARTKMLWTCLLLLAAGIVLMQAGTNAFWVTAGLFLSGAGLAEGFPVMLGFVGERFSKLSGTAFSLVFSIALVGNMLINYLMGIVVKKYGVAHLTTVAYIEIACMAILFILLIKQSNHKK